MKKTIASIYTILILAILMIGACKKADQAFEQLKQIPELDLTREFAYDAFYLVGDTLVMYGRLHPEKSDFRVRIGDTIAPVIGWDHVPGPPNTTAYPHGLDRVQLKITAGMGIGKNRPVHINSGGYNIEGPAIEISSQASGGQYLSDSLEVAGYYDSPDPDRKILYCVNGKGSIYLYEYGAFNLLRNGAITPVLSAFTDQHGTFGIQYLFSGGIDPREQYLYFSALCTESSTDAVNNHIFRLCRYNLQSRELITLNRTLFPKKWQNVSLNNWQPFEGAIAQTRFFAAQAIYPDSKGNVILDLYQPIMDAWFGDDVVVPAVTFGSLSAQAMLRPDGTLKYQYKTDGGSRYRIRYWDAASQSVVSSDAVPGIPIDQGITTRFSPEDQLMYVLYAVGFQGVGYRVYDLASRSELYNFAPKADFNSYEITGPFSALNFRADPYSLSNTGQFDFFPLPGERLMVLFFTRGYPQVNGKTTVLDFTKNQAEPYAPYIEIGSYHNKISYGANSVLNYDEEGNLYFVTYDIDWELGIEKREIVKTKKR